MAPTPLYIRPLSVLGPVTYLAVGPDGETYYLNHQGKWQWFPKENLRTSEGQERLNLG